MKLNFYFEFASTYSYLSAARIQAKARAFDIEVAYRPFLLGPIFKAQGWNDSPFNIYPARGKYMWRDLARQSAKYGLNFHKPSQFPRNGLRAASLATAALDETWLPAFVHRVFQANFEKDLNIANSDVLKEILAEFVADPADLMQYSRSNTIQDRLRKNTDAAMEAGIFGAPTFEYKHELFWGDDRLEDALHYISASIQ